MTPMIDVVFLLLIFFLWTASFQAVEYLLPSSLEPPATRSGQVEDESEWEDLEYVVVRIHQHDASPRWSLNGDPIQRWDELEERMHRVAAIRNDLPVVVDPDDLVPLEDVIAVYDVARLAGFQQIRFVARDEPERVPQS